MALRGRRGHYSNVPAVTKAWHEIVADLRRTSDVFDDWGMFAYTSADTGVDYLTEIDVGIWSSASTTRRGRLGAGEEGHRRRGDRTRRLDQRCHGSCREGEVDLVPEELAAGSA